MISRRPMWMLLVTCALLSSGSSTMALAASQRGGAQGAESSHQGELLLSQATESAAEEATGTVERPTLSLGSSGPLVIQIQVLLQEQGLYSGSINGDFDADTVKAVKEFQTENDLEPTGSLDSSTWGPLTGEIAEPEAEDPSEEAQPSPDPAANDAGPSNQMRLLIAAAALIGLGAGGFGLWKMLSVPVPQPLAYSNEEEDDDDYMDDLDEGQNYAPPSMESNRPELPQPHDVSPITVPASLAAQSPTKATLLAEETAEEFEEEQGDFSGLEELELPDLVSETAVLDESPVIKASTQQSLTIEELGEMSSVEEQVNPTREEVDVAAAAAHQQKVSLQQAVVKDATGQPLAEVKIDAAQRKLKEESPTDTAVAIATQNARAAARQKDSTTQRKKTAKNAAQSLATIASTKSKPKSPKSTGQRKQSLAKTRSTKLGKNKRGRTFQSPPPPPPAPSEIIRATPAGALEQPELVTTPLIGRVDIVETLITDLQGADPAKRRKAIWELGQRCDSRAIQPLVNMMANSDSRQRSLILAALSEIGTQTLKPMKQALAISLQDDNAEVRKNAIRDLTRIYELVAQISHLLNSALEDPDPEVQDTARWALKQLNRIRSNAGLEGTSDQPILQQSVSPPESFAGEGTFKPRSLPKA